MAHLAALQKPNPQKVKPANNFGAGMNRYRRGAAILVLPTRVPAFLAGAHESEPLSGADKLSALAGMRDGELHVVRKRLISR